MFYRISRGGEMCLFLTFFWRSGVLGDVQTRRFFAINSRFGEFNSRLGRHKFPVRSATGIGSQAIDLLCRFSGPTALAWVKSQKFPVSTGKTGNLASLKAWAWRGLAKRRRPPLPGADRPVCLPTAECSPQNLSPHQFLHRAIDEIVVLRVLGRVAGAVAPDRRDRAQLGMPHVNNFALVVGDGEIEVGRARHDQGSG